MIKFSTALIASVVGIFAILFVVLTFRSGPLTTVQRGFRGTGMEQVLDTAAVQRGLDENIIPAALPRVVAGPKAGTVYKNVQVLGDLSVGEFTRLMASITTWVAPKQGCNYCHNAANMAEDSNYTKVVARKMLLMTQHVNADWQSHVVGVGVTCYTCHRGNNIPVNIWFENPGPLQPAALMDNRVGKNLPSSAAGGASLPFDPFTPFLENDANIRVNSQQALPSDANRSSIKQADWTYALMMHMSTGLGVNCTYCHNTRAFADWASSPPQRVTAWYGIRMVRDLNAAYLKPLTDVFPEHRLGALGDVAKVNCTTCHQGVYKPLYGVNMVKDFPELTHATTLPQAALDNGIRSASAEPVPGLVPGLVPELAQ